jgi:hypothetical protein
MKTFDDYLEMKINLSSDSYTIINDIEEIFKKYIKDEKVIKKLDKLLCNLQNASEREGSERYKATVLRKMSPGAKKAEEARFAKQLKEDKARGEKEAEEEEVKKATSNQTSK